jgi:hypothetical protein
MAVEKWMEWRCDRNGCDSVVTRKNDAETAAPTAANWLVTYIGGREYILCEDCVKKLNLRLKSKDET